MEIRESIQGDLKGPLRRRISDLRLGYDFCPEDKKENFLCLSIHYSPLTQEVDGTFSAVSQLSGNVSIDWGKVSPEINQKLKTLEKILASHLPSYEINVTADDTLITKATIRQAFCHYNALPPTGKPSQLSVIYSFPTQPKQSTQLNLQWDELSRSQQLAVSNVTSWAKKKAWEDLANRIRAISGQPAQVPGAHRVFLSYKQRSKAESIAEIIAHRLSQQQIEVWFDKWEIKAGDSVPGKVGEGFKESDACLVFLESQYGSSGWCTKEMNTALTKAINENFTIIPILVEDCKKPELLKDIKHVYLKDPDAQEFERKLVEITDAVYKVDLNPYR